MTSLTKALGLRLFLLSKTRRNKKDSKFNHDTLEGLTDKGPRVPHGGATWMGPRMAHDLLKDARQGGVDFKLFRST